MDSRETAWDGHPGWAMLTYQDPMDGRVRIKRRYIYAFWAFVLGVAAGVALMVIVAP